MNLKQYLEENTLNVSGAEKAANELAHKKSIIRDKINKLEAQGGHEDEIARLRKELQALHRKHNKLSVQ
jgi:hypothetical protein